MSFRQSKYSNIPQDTSNGVVSITGSIRYVIQAISHFQFYFVLLSYFRKKEIVFLSLVRFVRVGFVNDV